MQQGRKQKCDGEQTTVTTVYHQPSIAVLSCVNPPIHSCTLVSCDHHVTLTFLLDCGVLLLEYHEVVLTLHPNHTVKSITHYVYICIQIIQEIHLACDVLDESLDSGRTTPSAQ